MIDESKYHDCTLTCPACKYRAGYLYAWVGKEEIKVGDEVFESLEGTFRLNDDDYHPSKIRILACPKCNNLFGDDAFL